MGKSEPVQIPYSACARFEFSNGTLKVFPPPEAKPLFAVKSGEDNFFPGYFLLQRLSGAEQTLT